MLALSTPIASSADGRVNCQPKLPCGSCIVPSWSHHCPTCLDLGFKLFQQVGTCRQHIGIGQLAAANVPISLFLD